MIRLGKYHLIAALGLVLAYHAIGGVLTPLPSGGVQPVEETDGGPVAAPWEPASEGASPGPLSGPETSLNSPPSLDPVAVIIDLTPTPMAAHLVAAESSPAQTKVPILPDTGAQPAAPSQIHTEADTIPTAAPQVEKPGEAGAESSAQTMAQSEAQAPRPTLEPLAEVPMRLVIPAIELDAPIVPARARTLEFRGESFQQWLAPAFFAAGWHSGSALLGSPGNTVLNGHHNIDGKVFGRLVDLEFGDRIQIYSDQHLFIYQITNRMIVPEKYQQMDTRMANAQWILPSQDERLTLITCWPDETNTHRVIIVAVPVEQQALD